LICGEPPGQAARLANKGVFSREVARPVREFLFCPEVVGFGFFDANMPR
jgi:hypothetical protein